MCKKQIKYSKDFFTKIKQNWPENIEMEDIAHH